MSGPLKLHVGCGTNKIPGWVNIDAVQGCQPDLVHDLGKPLPYAAQSADELMAHGVLEHFDKYMRYSVMGDWVRVLKVGGTIDLAMPDFKKLLFKFFKFRFDDFVDTMFGENMWENEVYIGHFGNHKWGYSQESLVEFAKPFGIETIEVKTKGLNIHFKGKKVRHVPEEEMAKWTIHSHNNKFGSHGHQLTLTQVKAKIDEFHQHPHH